MCVVRREGGGRWGEEREGGGGGKEGVGEEKQKQGKKEGESQLLSHEIDNIGDNTTNVGVPHLIASHSHLSLGRTMPCMPCSQTSAAVQEVGYRLRSPCSNPAYLPVYL